MEEETLTQQVRNALFHLYDIPHLQNHPLAQAISSVGDEKLVSRGRMLRQLLLEAIEQLRPGSDAASDLTDDRSYKILFYRYVDGMRPDEIMEQLAISKAQYYRDHRAGIDAIVSILSDYLHTDVSDKVAQPLSSDLTKMDRRTLAQIEAERVVEMAEPEILDLVAVLQDLAQMLEPLSHEIEVSLEITLPASLPLIYADRAVLRQALMNIMTNAIDMVPGGVAAMAARRKGWEVHVEITTQPGEERPTIRERTGVGLVISQQLLESQGGKMDLQESPWQVLVRLPVLVPATVLVVDDNAEMVKLFRRYLAGQPVRVHGANSGTEALELAKRLRPKVITLDLMMPHRDGWEILQTLKTAPETRDVPVVVCSVLNEPRLALSLGADAYLKKPISQSALLQVLRQWLALSSSTG